MSFNVTQIILFNFRLFEFLLGNVDGWVRLDRKITIHMVYKVQGIFGVFLLSKYLSIHYDAIN